MKTKQLSEVLKRVENWPPRAQDELAEIARNIEESLSNGDYEPTEAELAGIDRGLRAAAEGRFATDEEIEAALAKLRGARRSSIPSRLLTISTRSRVGSSKIILVWSRSRATLKSRRRSHRALAGKCAAVCPPHRHSRSAARSLSLQTFLSSHTRSGGDSAHPSRSTPALG
jgi:predicted transcriptional regulator